MNKHVKTADFWPEVIQKISPEKYFEAYFAERIANEYGDKSDTLKLFLFYLAFQTVKGNLRISWNEKICGNLQLFINELIYYVPLFSGIKGFEAVCLDLKNSLPGLFEQNPKIFGKKNDFKPVIIEKDYGYLQKYYYLEKKFLSMLDIRIKNEISCDGLTTEEPLNKTKAHLLLTQNMQLNKEQESAVVQSLNKNFVIITGGPGTGKTTLVVNILRALLYSGISADKKLKIILSAPTGRAAARLSDSINASVNYTVNDLRDEEQKKIDSLLALKGQTLHRVLKRKKEDPFYRDTEEKIQADVIIVDEASMIDIELFSELMEKIPLHCKIILIGDKNQLPAVEAGAVFHDLIPKKNDMNHKLKNHVAELIQSKRHDESIQKLSKAIKEIDTEMLLKFINGKKNLNNLFSENVSFFDMEEFEFKQVFDKIFIKFFLSNLDEGLKSPTEDLLKDCPLFQKIFSVLNNFKILCVTNDGLTGIESVNNLCAGHFHFKNEDIYNYKPVIILKNDYQNGLSNGDQGIFIKLKDGVIKAFFPSDNKAEKSFLPFQLKNHATGYAVTVHKSQGSEYDTVLLVLPSENMPILTNELIYTAITRAKKNLFIIGKKSVFLTSVKKTIQRDSGIREFLLS